MRCKKKVGRAACVAAAVAIVSLTLPIESAAAQESRWRPFMTISPLFESEADLDQGGQVSVGGAITRIGAMTRLGERGNAGVILNLDYLNYSFSGSAFDGVAPWKGIERYGLSVPFQFALQDGWAVGFVPGVDWFREDNSDGDESLVWSGLMSATRRFDNGNRLGFGFAVVEGLEETRLFPLLVIDWQLSAKWKLINPFADGPSGPAGLELDYLITDAWAVGVGATWRVTRFRLSDDGPVPNGVGEQRVVPVFLRATHDFSQQLVIHFSAGVVAGGELRIENASGTLVSQDDVGLAPLFGLSLAARF